MDHDKELEEITRELAASNVKLASRRAQVAALEEELAEVRANRVRLEKDVEEKRATLEAKTTELVRLRAQLSNTAEWTPKNGRKQ